MPQKIESSDPIRAKTPLLIAEPGHHVPYRWHPATTPVQGYRLRLLNPTEKEIVFTANDSRLAILCEALGEQGVWRPIEYFGSSFCGNSFHSVFLPAGHQWEFVAPVYQGSFKTRLRFVLDEGKEPRIYSNEFEAVIDSGQMIAPVSSGSIEDAPRLPFPPPQSDFRELLQQLH